MDNNLTAHFDLERLKQNLGNNDAIIVKMKAIGFKSLEEYLRVFKELLETKDFVQVKKSAHKLKGSASGLCFGILTELAKNLEASDFSNEAAIRDSISEILKEINFVLTILKSA